MRRRFYFAARVGAMGAALLAPIIAAGASAEEFRHLRVDGRLVRWVTPQTDTPLTLTYAVAERDVPGGSFGTCGTVGSPEALLKVSGLTRSDLDNAIRQALVQWQGNVNINFVPAASALEAQIVFGISAPARGIAFTDLDLLPSEHSPTGTRTIVRSVICLNPDKPWKTDFDPRTDRYDLETVLSHELGHVLGLDHPSAQGHVMSFRYSEGNRGLTAGDREGAVRLYGMRRATAD